MIKKILCMLVLINSLAFGIIDFEGIDWGDKHYSVIMYYPGMEKIDSFQKGIDIYEIKDPTKEISTYKFYFDTEKIFKVEIQFNDNMVGPEKLREIYKTLVSKYGNPIFKESIDKKLISTTLRGNAQVFSGSDKTILLFKGVDTIDQDNKMTDSKLLLEYVDKKYYKRRYK